MGTPHPVKPLPPIKRPCYPLCMTVIDLGTQGKVDIGAEKGKVFILSYPPRPETKAVSSVYLGIEQARQARDALDAALAEATRG
jgi:hypothetical protein